MSLTYFANIYIPPLWPQSYQSLLPRSLLSTNSKLQTNQTQRRGLRSNISTDESSTNESKKENVLTKHHIHCHLCMDIRMLHYITKGCLPTNTSIFVPSSSEGLTSAVCPCVFIFLSLSRPLSGLSAKGALCCASGPGWGAAAPGTFIVATPEM